MYKKAQRLIHVGYNCMIEVPHFGDAHQWVNDRLDVMPYDGEYYMTKPSVATLYRCKFGNVQTRKVTAYELANKSSTYFDVNERDGAFGEEYKVTHIENGNYADIRFQETERERVTWRCHGNSGWMAPTCLKADVLGLALFRMDEDEFSYYRANYCMSFAEYADMVEKETPLKTSSEISDFRSKLLNFDDDGGRPFDYYHIKDLRWFVGALKIEGIYSMAVIPDPEIITIPGVNVD